MEKAQGFMKALKCRECGREYPLTATHVCEFDFGPLEVAYDYDRIKKSLTRAAIQSRAKSMWRYRELLPVADGPTVGLQVGFTPLIKADRLAKRLGIRELWIKNDTVNYPTPLVQRPRGERGVEPGARTGFHDGRLRFDRQPGQFGGGQRRRRRAEGVRFHSRRIWSRERSSTR